MELFAIIFQSASALLAFLAAAILLWVNKEQLHSNRILAIVLLVLSLINLNAVLLYSAGFLQFPRLHKFALPFTFLISPVAWLYIKSVLRGELKSSKKDWLVLIPFLICVIDLMPYYTMPLAEKKSYLENFYRNPFMQAQFSEGILPPYVFSFIRVVWSGVFIALNFKLIRQFKKEQSKPLLLNNDALIKWLTLFNWLLVGMLLSALVIAIIAPVFKTSYAYVDLVVAISVVIICLQLFTQPTLLYGVFQPLNGYVTAKEGLQPIMFQSKFEKEGVLTFEGVMDTPLTEKPETELIFSQDDCIRYKKIIETFFDRDSPFLQIDYSLEKLVKDTSIPRHALSAFINREYGIGFREFLNRYRVKYFMDNLKRPDWENLTLEAIAVECGYGTRSTFIANFKQITGQTPSEYIKNLPK